MLPSTSAIVFRCYLLRAFYASKVDIRWWLFLSGLISIMDVLSFQYRGLGVFPISSVISHWSFSIFDSWFTVHMAMFDGIVVSVSGSLKLDLQSTVRVYCTVLRSLLCQVQFRWAWSITASGTSSLQHFCLCLFDKLFQVVDHICYSFHKPFVTETSFPLLGSYLHFSYIIKLSSLTVAVLSFAFSPVPVPIAT